MLISLKLHWVSATALDQFLFSPIFNVLIFFFITAAFKGGLEVHASSGETMSLTFSIVTSRFPPLLTYEPVHSTQVKAYYLWLPATVVREKHAPPLEPRAETLPVAVCPRHSEPILLLKLGWQVRAAAPVASVHQRDLIHLERCIRRRASK